MDLQEVFQRFFARVYESASRRGGLVSEEEALRLLPGEWLPRALAEGLLMRVAPGVVRLTSFQPLQDERAAIALLRTSAGGVLSRQSALAQWGLCEAPGVVHLSYPVAGFEDVIGPEGVQVHFEDIPRAERGWSHGLQVTTVERALADCRREGVDEALVRGAERRAKQRKLIIDRAEVRPEIVDPALRAGLLEALDTETNVDALDPDARRHWADTTALPYELTPLRELKCAEGTAIRDLRGLEYYTALEVLDLRRCDFVAGALAVLPGLPFLKAVHLQVNAGTELAPLERCVELRRVRLEGFDAQAHAEVRARLEARGVVVDLLEGALDPSPFEDANLKLAVLEALCAQNLVQVPALIAIDELELDVPHYRRVVSTPLSAAQLAAVTEVRWSLGGQQFQHLVWPQYDGETEEFAIRSLGGLEALPNLQLVELDGMGLEEAFQREVDALRARGVVVELHDVS